MHCLEVIRKMNNQTASLAFKPDHFETRVYKKSHDTANNNQRLRNIKQALDAILAEAQNSPMEIQQSITLARDNIWKLFVEAQKKEEKEKASKQIK